MSRDAKVIVGIMLLIAGLVIGYFALGNLNEYTEAKRFLDNEPLAKLGASLMGGAIEKQMSGALTQTIMLSVTSVAFLIGALTMLGGKGAAATPGGNSNSTVWETYKNRSINIVDGSYTVDKETFSTLNDARGYIDTTPEPKPDSEITKFEGRYCIGIKEFADYDSANTYAENLKTAYEENLKKSK